MYQFCDKRENGKATRVLQASPPCKNAMSHRTSRAVLALETHHLSWASSNLTLGTLGYSQVFETLYGKHAAALYAQAADFNKTARFYYMKAQVKPSWLTCVQHLKLCAARKHLTPFRTIF
jgi:hypothetical protein